MPSPHHVIYLLRGPRFFGENTYILCRCFEESKGKSLGMAKLRPLYTFGVLPQSGNWFPETVTTGDLRWPDAGIYLTCGQCGFSPLQTLYNAKPSAAGLDLGLALCRLQNFVSHQSTTSDPVCLASDDWAQVYLVQKPQLPSREPCHLVIDHLFKQRSAKNLGCVSWTRVSVHHQTSG